MRSIKTIETRYNGHHFRSRLEARWALFFDGCRLPYYYEPEGYDLAATLCPHHPEDEASCVCHDLATIQGKDTWYLPDFFLPTLTWRGEKEAGIFFEVKGILNSKDASRCKLLGALTQRPVILASILPLYPSHDAMPGLEQVAPWWDDYMMFMRCTACNHIKIEFAESNYMYCPLCENATYDRDTILTQAAFRARSARFT